MKRLAFAAYSLACLSALAVPVRALGYVASLPQRHLIPLWTVLWWLAAIAAPLGAVLGGLCALLRSESGRRIPHPRATAAIVVGGFSALIMPYMIRYVDEARGILYDNSGRKAACFSNLRQVGLAVSMYAQDYDRQLPFAASWHDAVYPYLKNEYVFQCPSAEDQTQSSYGLNRRITGLHLPDLSNPVEAVMDFDSIPGRNQAGGVELLPEPPRHVDGENIGFIDGHVKFTAEGRIPSLEWRPTLLTTGAPEHGDRRGRRVRSR